MDQSSHHQDIPWVVVGKVKILYHTTISMSISVSYDERSVFGSHGAYAVWTGTEPRSFDLSASMVAANTKEAEFNVSQVAEAYDWTQQSPPQCQALVGPIGAGSVFNTDVRILSVSSSIPETVHLTGGEVPIQIDLSLSLKECKAI